MLGSVPSACFDITFRGQAGPALISEFDDLHVSVAEGATTVRGTVADQAALQGVLARLFDLGLDVIDINVCHRDTEDDDADDA